MYIYLFIYLYIYIYICIHTCTWTLGGREALDRAGDVVLADEESEEAEASKAKGR